MQKECEGAVSLKSGTIVMEGSYAQDYLWTSGQKWNHLCTCGHMTRILTCFHIKWWEMASNCGK